MGMRPLLPVGLGPTPGPNTSKIAGAIAEVLVAGDSSCLMQIGGVLSRQGAGVRTMHLAEVLAATEEDA